MTAEASNAERVLTFELVQPIRWGDMDAMGHVNNTVYFRYMEQTRISWFSFLGLPPDPTGEGPIIVNTFCNFLRELAYPGDIICRHYVGAIGRSSFDTMIDIVRADDPQTVCAAGGAKVVWVNFPKRKSEPLPPWARAAILRSWQAP